MREGFEATAEVLRQVGIDRSELATLSRGTLLAKLLGADGTPILGMVRPMIKAYAALHHSAVGLADVMEQELRTPPNGQGRGLQRDALLHGLAKIQALAEQIGYGTTAQHVAKLHSRVSKHRHIEGDLPADIKNIRERLKDDGDNLKLFAVAPEHVDLYAQPDLFGPEVAAKFPSAQRDLTEAGTCQALGCPTAAAMHLMRAMESALKTLAQNVAGIQPGHKDTMGMVAEKLRQFGSRLPETTLAETQKKRRVLKASLHFDAVTQALRNPTMHSSEFWTVSEVASALENAKNFLKDLAAAF